MHTTRTRAVAALAAGILLLGACGDDSDSDDSDANPPEQDRGRPDDGGDTGGGDGDGDGDGGSGDGPASLAVHLDGGADDGSHEATAEGGCSRHPLGEGTFGLQHSTDGEDGLHSFQVEIDDAVAASTGTDQFSATARVNGNRYHLRRGDGLVALEDEGGTARMTISGTTEEGVSFSATVDCHTVLDLG